MKVNNPNLAPAGAPATYGSVSSAEPHETGKAKFGDDLHLSELVRNLRALAVESPERQERIESIARAYARGGTR